MFSWYIIILPVFSGQASLDSAGPGGFITSRIVWMEGGMPWGRKHPPRLCTHFSVAVGLWDWTLMSQNAVLLR